MVYEKETKKSMVYEKYKHFFVVYEIFAVLRLINLLKRVYIQEPRTLLIVMTGQLLLPRDSMHIFYNFMIIILFKI